MTRYRIAVVLCAALSTACLSGSQTQAAVSGGVDVTVCILNHSTEPVEQIAKDCGVAAVQDVARVIEAARASAIREQCAPSPDSHPK